MKAEPLFLAASLSLALLCLLTPESRAEAPSEILLPAIELSPTNAADPAFAFVHLPPSEKRNGTVVVVCPGGGYGHLTMGSEGHDTAHWLVERGVVGVVLQYRLPGTNGNTYHMPLDDAHAAMRLVRQHALEWNIDPHRVGVWGYSAGGHLAATAATHFDVETRPDFQVLIYPVVTMGQFTHAGSRSNLLGKNPDPALVKLYSNELQVTSNTPPAFLAAASDDRIEVMNSVNYYIALHEAGVPAELHVYERGGHGLKGGAGYGIGGISRTISGTWPERAADWMGQRGLLGSWTNSVSLRK